MAKKKKSKPIAFEPLSLPKSKKPPLTPAERNRLLLRLFMLIAILALTAFLYYFTNSLFPYAFLFFYGAALLLGFGYVIANRCLSRSGATLSDLPPTMSDEEKRIYLDEREVRRRHTAWMLYLLIPLLLVIGFDVIYLLQGENIAKLFR